MTPQTVYQRFSQTATKWPNNPFMCVLPETAELYGIKAGELVYGDALQRIQRLVEQYRQAGYGHGHRVGLLLENRPAFFLHWFALNALGVSVVPINADLRAAELEYLIGHSEMLLAIALPERHTMLLEAAKVVDSPLAVMADGDTPPAPARPAPLADRQPDTHTECALLYTSGTTGRPKGCILPNEYFLYCGIWYATRGGYIKLQEGVERMLTPLPLVHMNAMACSTMGMVQTGGCLIVLDRFHPRSWWDSVRDSRATVVHYLGVMPAILMKADASPDDTRHQVRFGFGAGIDRTLHETFEARFGFPLLEGWAMTETGSGGVIQAYEEPRFVGTACFGKEPPEVEVRIVDDADNEVAPGQEGELLVRRKGDEPRFGFFAGYLKDPVATDEAWAGGWFHTGDVVRRNEQGYLQFIDRKKNVIRRSGENIAAVEVEAVLLQHPAIKAAAAAAAPDDVRGDEVLAVIVCAQPPSPQDMQALAQDIVQHGLQRLAYYKVPGYVVFVDSLPLTATNKIQRGELKKLVPQLLASEHCFDTRSMKKRQDIPV
ncbi:AMP-binding protein [Pusillimonas sp. CC-YST705]|uniref:AMP-binding protein n=1 Tax=Mesopusillimonas faecipullorum TaxID=2755040 RepID=A0ABS8C9Q4_9BURK|nr:AMP-binding protein [Mesopusillimonas faecipullorum]MCB5362763.1 AMP-binding protein [Mesopusillimonas faecipullorum]